MSALKSRSFANAFDACWALCCQPAGTADQGVPGPAEGWLAIEKPQPVAAALQELGLFSLDALGRTFDDEVIWYRADFDQPEAREAEAASLVLDGLATVVEVWLNGEPVLSSRNMFRQWLVPLEGRLRAKGNRLLMRFEALNARLGESRRRPRWRVPMLEQQQLRWWRTTLLGRTPGWSPPVAVVGPWLPIWIHRCDALRPEVLKQRAWLDGATGHYRVEVAAQVLPLEASVHLLHDGVQVQGDLLESGAIDGTNAKRLVANLCVDQARAWWPHTHGDPALYQAWIEWTDARGQACRIELARVGFRRIHVARDDEGFAFHVNGVSVFCRGACWTPLDPLRLRAEPAAYDTAIAQLRSAGMNMVRIVGA
ncbi:MAG: hypothetical protein JSS56_26915, partial [Proteobacteria bacterium]|nr:hypothetical protein [Pseudomonadota bacterium]